MSDKYLLKGHEPYLVDDFLTWAHGFETLDRQVANTQIGDVRVSTVFLGLDYSFGRVEIPILFETMIFGGTHDEYQNRCSTWEEAEAMHARAVALVEGK